MEKIEVAKATCRLAGLVVPLLLAGCATQEPLFRMTYEPPLEGPTAALRLNNLSAHHVLVGVFEDAMRCTGKRELHYDSDRDEDTTPEIAYYDHGKPVYFRRVTTKHTGVTAGKSLRNVTIPVGPNRLQLSIATPHTTEKLEFNRQRARWKECTIQVLVEAERDVGYELDFHASEASNLCSVQLFRVAAATSVRQAVAPSGPACPAAAAR
jgi:hypothetical protein